MPAAPRREAGMDACKNTTCSSTCGNPLPAQQKNDCCSSKDDLPERCNMKLEKQTSGCGKTDPKMHDDVPAPKEQISERACNELQDVSASGDKGSQSCIGNTCCTEGAKNAFASPAKRGCCSDSSKQQLSPQKEAGCSTGGSKEQDCSQDRAKCEAASPIMGCCSQVEKECSAGLGGPPCSGIAASAMTKGNACCTSPESTNTAKSSCCTSTVSPGTQSCHKFVEKQSKSVCCPSSKSEEASCKATVDEILKSKEMAIHTLDLEKGPKVFEHAIITVEGMTCTGCETKLSKSLSSMPSVFNLQTSLVLSRAEFDIDIGIISVHDLIAQLQKMTGFNCERITNSGHELDVRIMRNSRVLLSQNLPRGVTDMVLLDSETVRIHYDAKVIGARDLLDRGSGAPLHLAPPRPDSSLAAGSKHVRKIGLLMLLSIMLTIPVLVLEWAPLQGNDNIYDGISFGLATIVQVVVAGPFYSSALKGLLFAHVIEMDLLIVLSTSTAYIFSVVSYVYNVRGEPFSVGEFFETSTLLVTLIMVGRFVGALARQKAVESISIRSLQVTTALLVTEDGKLQSEIDSRLLQYGDIFRVVPDSRVVTDGTVVSGSSEVDESMVTGESRLVEKTVASSVIAGSMNGSGLLDVRVTRLPGDNTISTIAKMVDEAKLSKPKTQELADHVAGYFVPVVIMLTIIAFVIWIAVGIKIRGQPGSQATIQAVTYAIAVLIVSCPCAIGLAVPMVIVIAGGVAADHGVIFKTAETIDLARKASHVVFDKTGTLTLGKLSVCIEQYAQSSRETTVPIILGLLSNINHPISAAVFKHLKATGMQPSRVDDIKTITGKGVEGNFEGLKIQAGNSRWTNTDSHPQVSAMLAQNLTVFCLTINNDLHAIFGLTDTLRPDAAAVISSLTARGIAVSIVSGDDDGAVQSTASQLKIPPSHTKSRFSPAEKAQYVQDLMSSGNSTVIFVGDGTNDAVALAAASIGIHINSGTDVAQSAADVVLTRPALGGILVLMDLSGAAFRRIAFNFLWAGMYNLFAILLAAGAFVRARIPPAYAGLGEIVSVLPVIVIAMQLKYVRFSKDVPE